MADAIVGAIGLSLLNSTQPNLSSDAGHEDKNESQSKKCPPSLLSVASSLISDEDEGQSSKCYRAGHDKILLQGPPGCGRSSIAMDFALELATTLPCRCESQEAICNCSPVVFLRSDSKEDSFPLRCCQQSLGSDAESTFQARIDKLTKNAGESFWSNYALRRMSVHHIASFRDILHYLLSLSGKPACKQPFGAIVIDDVECLVEGGLASKDKIYHIMQLLAILMDTVRYLKCSPRLLITLNTDIHFPVDSFMASFFTSKIFLRENLQSRMHWNTEGNKMVIMSSWCVESQKETKNGQFNRNKTVEYAICRNCDEDHRIIWRKV